MKCGVRKWQLLLGLHIQNTYNKKSPSKCTKIRSYNTVIKLNGAVNLILNRKKKDIEVIQKRERKIIRKILGPKRSDDHLYRL